MIYAWRYPKSIHRSVMIGVNPPGHFLWDPKTTDAQIQRYSRLCAQDAALQQADGRPRGDDARRRQPTCPSRFWGLPFDENAARVASFYGLMESTVGVEAPLSAPMTISTRGLGRQGRPERALVPVADGEDGVPRVLRLGRAGRDEQGRHPRRRSGTSQGAASQGLDPRQPRHRVPLRRRRARRTPGRPTPDENEYAKVRDSNVETLLVGGTLDFATPPSQRDQGAAAAPPERPAGRALRARPHRLLLDRTSRRRARAS